MQTAKSQTGYYVNSAIVVLIMFCFGFLPSFGGITEMGMKVLGIFLGVLYGWIFVGFIWPSLLGMFALGLSGYDSILNVYIAGFGDGLVLKIFFLFLFARYLDECGLTTFIAHWFIGRKVCQGRPWILTTAIFIATALICGFINVYGGIVIMWYILYSILKTAGYKRGDGYTSYMVAGIVFIGTQSMIMLPFLPMPIIFRGLLKPELLANYDLSMTAMTIFSMTLLIAMLAGYLLIGKMCIRDSIGGGHAHEGLTEVVGKTGAEDGEGQTGDDLIGSEEDGEHGVDAVSYTHLRFASALCCRFRRADYALRPLLLRRQPTFCLQTRRGHHELPPRRRYSHL